jgi:hypothetical protein
MNISQKRMGQGTKHVMLFKKKVVDVYYGAVQCFYFFLQKWVGERNRLHDSGGGMTLSQYNQKKGGGGCRKE